jgi:hypothetical protein
MATKSGKETGAALSGNKKSSTRKSRREDFDKKISNAKDKRTQTFYEVYNVLKKDAGAALPNKVMGEGFDKLVAKKLSKETGAALNDNEKSAIKKLTGFDNKNDFIKYKYGMNQGGSVKMKAKGYRRGGAPMGMAAPGKKVPAMIKRPAASAPGTRTPMAPPGTTAQRLPPSGGPKAIDTTKLGALPPSGGPKAIDTTKLGALPQSRSTRPTKATAMRGAAARRSGGSTPRGMNMGGAAMKTKGYAKGGAAMKTKGAAKGGVTKPSSSKSGLYGRR